MTHLSIVHVNFAELRESVSLNEELLLELVAHGIVTPIEGKRREEWLFSVSAVNIVQKAARIHRDLAIDWADIALLLSLLERLDALQAENALLKQRLSRFITED